MMGGVIMGRGLGGPWSADWTTSLCAQSKQAHRMLAIHHTSAAAEGNWSAWARTYRFAQPAEQRDSRELVYTKVNMPAS
eukprot:1156147-Pelagomonas_calceolata.AAC.4